MAGSYETAGPLSSLPNSLSYQSASVTSLYESNDDLREALKFFWSLETIGMAEVEDEGLSQEDSAAVKLMEQVTTYSPSIRRSPALPRAQKWALWRFRKGRTQQREASEVRDGPRSLLSAVSVSDDRDRRRMGGGGVTEIELSQTYHISFTRDLNTQVYANASRKHDPRSTIDMQNLRPSEANVVLIS